MALSNSSTSPKYKNLTKALNEHGSGRGRKITGWGCKLKTRGSGRFGKADVGLEVLRSFFNSFGSFLLWISSLDRSKGEFDERIFLNKLD